MTPLEKQTFYKLRVKKGNTIDWLDGQTQCFGCHKNVFEYIDDKTVMEGSITGCPVCHRSFVD